MKCNVVSVSYVGKSRFVASFCLKNCEGKCNDALNPSLSVTGIWVKSSDDTTKNRAILKNLVIYVFKKLSVTSKRLFGLRVGMSIPGSRECISPESRDWVVRDPEIPTGKNNS